MATASRIRPSSFSSSLVDVGRHIPEVVKIAVDQQGDIVSVWTVVEEFSRDVRERVYEGEEQVIHEHPRLKFDFHVVRRGSYPDTYLQSIIYSR